MSYHRNEPGQRGRMTDQFARERTGYHRSMGAATRATPSLTTAMPRIGVQPTVPFVGRRVIRRASQVIVPRSPRQLTAPAPARYRGMGPKRRPLRPPERLSVDLRPRIAPPPNVVPPPPGPRPAPRPPAPASPPLPDDIDLADPFDWGTPEPEGGEALEELVEPTPVKPPAKPFPWKTVGVVAAIGTALYLIGRK